MIDCVQYIAETETGRIFYSPPRPDQKKLLTGPTRPELNLSFAPRPASPRSEFHLCSPAPPRPDLSFTFASRLAPIRKELLPAPPRPAPTPEDTFIFRKYNLSNYTIQRKCEENRNTCRKMSSINLIDKISIERMVIMILFEEE